MKKILSFLAFAAFTVAAQAQTPAFPGAEGHGRYVTGGRGGKVIHVTNLNDSGTGSFRQAVSGNDKKIVVFDVGGVIPLTKDVNIGANTTILGQTAPAPGITLRYFTVQFSGSGNVIVRFIRSRRGQEKNVNDGADAIWTRQKSGIILDHCSFSWSIDEVASFYDNNNFTMQWCTLGESLNNAGHGKGAHGYGGIWGGKLASFHHNLICHVNNRSPRFNGARYDWTGFTSNSHFAEYNWENAVQAENVDFRNCVIYNCGNGCYGGPGGGQINIVNNYYKTGPAGSTSQVTKISIANSTSSSDNEKYWNMTSRYYINGNQVNSNANYDWNNLSYDSGVQTINGERYTLDTNHYYGDKVTYVKNSAGQDCVRIKMDEPIDAGEVTTHSAVTSFDKVLTYAGASLVQDDVDQRYFNEARNGTATYKGSVTKKAGRIDIVSDVNGYTEENFGTGNREADFDTDKDGIPDAWEIANGLNPNDANDALLFTLDPRKDYSNLEVYANALVQDIMLAGNSDAISSVAEYYPAYTKEDGTKVSAINYEEPTPQEVKDVSYTLSQTTYESGSSTMEFADGVSISNTKGKGYAAGKDGGIKYSAGVQYTVNLPAKVSIDKAIFTGYDNYAEVDAYLSEVNGVTYESTQYVFPQKQGDAYTTVSHTVEFPVPASESFTFTPAGKQVVLTITLIGTQAIADAISTSEVNIHPVATTYYNLKGQRISTPTKGTCIEVRHLNDGSRQSRKVLK
jgi:hypothetical protein